MEKKIYKLRYLPLFEQDLTDTADYIANTLKNPQAARDLVDAVEEAILKRLDFPTSFEPYPSLKERPFCYYRIYVKNYIVFYVVIDDTMEVRRLLHKTRDTASLLQ